MDSIDDIIDLANRLIDNYKYEEAIKYLEEGIKKYPGNPDLYDLRGIAWFRRLELEKAIQDWKTAIALDEGYHLAYHHLTEYYIEKKDFAEAEKNISAAIEIEPENLYYQAHMAFIKLQLGEYEACIQYCNELLNKSPTYLTALEYRATAYQELKRYKEAAIDYETVCINSTDDAELCNAAGYSYSKAGEIEKAKKYLLKAITLDPGYSFPYDNLGFVYYLEKNFRKAHELIDKSIDLDPTNSYAFKNRALVFIAENNIQGAKESLEKAKSLKFELFYGDEVDKLLEGLRMQ